MGEVLNTGHSESSVERIPPVENNQNGVNALLIPRYILRYVCHPELVSGSYQILKHRGQSDVQKMLKQVQDDMFSFPKRTYSPIHLLTYSLYKQAAFTLAEVLITLVIIGIVAAMTMPSLISNYRHKVLESQFKKAYSVISQLGAMVISEYGDCSYSQTEDIKDFMLSNLVKGDQTAASDKYTNFFTYTKSKAFTDLHYNCLDNVSWTNSKSAASVDGMQFAFCSHNSSIGTIITVDTNGAGKRPNAFGHDIFFFHFNTANCKLEPISTVMRNCTANDTGCSGGNENYYGWKNEKGECSQNSTSTTNGFGCTQYAIANTCPDGSGKGYFDCLP